MGGGLLFTYMLLNKTKFIFFFFFIGDLKRRSHGNDSGNRFGDGREAEVSPAQLLTFYVNYHLIHMNN